MTPGGVVAGRLLAAFAPADRAEAARILAGWVRVPQLAVTDISEILAGYDQPGGGLVDDELRGGHVEVPNGEQHEGWQVGDRVRNGTDLPDDSQGWNSGPMGGDEDA